ncbi:hypothetical protein [Pyrobaculum ferrireducens]|uniref:hypothetical protein n=1 Tax=Pyrobaculum ferrireducens TaxID=1104324 RepID=UPI0011E58691|nr:hypothetical protein [Pyrobaculum ferrireducens]
MTEARLYHLLGVVGALAFCVEGVFLPISLAAHVLLLLSFRRLSTGPSPYAWFVSASTASLMTALALGTTPLRMLVTPYPYEPGNAVAVALLWLASGWFYWDVARSIDTGPLGRGSAVAYVLGAGLFPVRIGWMLVIAAMVMLALALLRPYLAQQLLYSEARVSGSARP